MCGFIFLENMLTLHLASPVAHRGEITSEYKVFVAHR